MKRVTKRVPRTQSRTLFDLRFVRVKSSVDSAGSGSSATESEIIDLTQSDDDVSVAGPEIEVKLDSSCEETEEPEPKVEPETKVEPEAQATTANKPARKPRVMPWFKKLAFNGITVSVDCFNCDKEPDIDLYFLSHFHSDHYGGLKKSWCNGSTIFTSIHTANLVKWKFKVNQCKVVGLPLHEWTSLSENLRVVLLDANHCPGSVIFLFHDSGDNSYVLHTGDFRANETIAQHVNAFLQGNKLQSIYLDTTYLNPHFRFPDLQKVCDVTADFASLLVKKGLNNFINRANKQRSISQYLSLSQAKPILFVVLSYSIGKEHLAIAIAKKINSKLYVPHTKYQLVKQYISWFPEDLVTTDHTSANVHLVSMHTDLDKYLSQLSDSVDSIVVFKPTGWTFSNQYDKSYMLWEDAQREKCVRETLESDTPFTVDHFIRQKKSQGKIYQFNVPYSEHSSFKDLCFFSTSLMWDKIIPTVNLSRYQEMQHWFNIWKSYQKN